MAEDMARMNLLVTGEVHGVFFRASTLEQAQSLSLTGWVQNLPDGTVEITAEGQRYALEELMAWAKRGPPAARVGDVMVRWQKFANEFNTFRIVR